MAFIKMCIYLAAFMSIAIFAAIVWVDQKIDNLKAEIKELKKEKDNG